MADRTERLERQWNDAVGRYAAQGNPMLAELALIALDRAGGDRWKAQAMMEEAWHSRTHKDGDADMEGDTGHALDTAEHVRATRPSRTRGMDEAAADAADLALAQRENEWYARMGGMVTGIPSREMLAAMVGKYTGWMLLKEKGKDGRPQWMPCSERKGPMDAPDHTKTNVVLANYRSVTGPEGDTHPASFRHEWIEAYQAVFFEMDGDDPEENRRRTAGTIAAIGVPPTSIVFTGNKSYHVVYRLARTADPERYEEMCRRLRPSYEALGLDPSNLNSTPTTRIPSGKRDGADAEGQRTVWLDPKASVGLNDYMEAVERAAGNKRRPGRPKADGSESDSDVNDYEGRAEWIASKGYSLWRDDRTGIGTVRDPDGILTELDGEGQDDLAKRLASLWSREHDHRRMTRDDMSAALDTLMYDDRRDPVREWLMSLEWDGKDRFGAVCDALGCAGEDRWMVRKWLLQTAAMGLTGSRGDGGETLRYGCAAVLVLVGPQGSGKTRFATCLVPEELRSRYYKDGFSLSTQSGGQAEYLQARTLSAKWIIELGELDSTMKADQARIKAIITEEEREYAEKWVKGVIRRPARCSLIATVNKDAFLRDETGGRRFWVPDIAGRIDWRKLESGEIDVAQVWAQAMAEIRGGAMTSRRIRGLFEPSEDEARRAALQAESRRVRSPQEERLLEMYDWTSPVASWRTGLTGDDIVVEAYGDSMNRDARDRLRTQVMVARSTILRVLGMDKGAAMSKDSAGRTYMMPHKRGEGPEKAPF